jgi:hypothetical protein
MVTPDLLSFVQRKLEGGLPPEQIQRTLAAHGWPPQTIQRALRLALPSKPITSDLSHGLSRDLTQFLFRLGFAGVFLVNALVAVIDPSGFIKLMQGSFMGVFIHNFTPLVWLIVINDLVLGLLILSGRWPNYVLAWSGLWLLAVSLIKLSSLF